MRTATQAEIALAADQLVEQFRTRYPGEVFSYASVTPMMRPGWWDLADIRAPTIRILEFYRAIEALRASLALVK